MDHLLSLGPQVCPSQIEHLPTDLLLVYFFFYLFCILLHGVVNSDAMEVAGPLVSGVAGKLLVIMCKYHICFHGWRIQGA
jgi:hypothetical protein